MGLATHSTVFIRRVVLSVMLFTFCARASEPTNESCATEVLPEDSEPIEPVDVIKGYMNLTKTHPDGKAEIVPANVYMGDDLPLAAFRFCVTHTYQGLPAMKQTIEILQALQNTLDQIEDPDLPEKLKTAGAHARRAKEATSEGRHLDAGADYLRALLRPGLDPQAAIQFEQALSSEYYSARRQLEAEAREREEAAKVAARAAAEAQAMLEAAARHAATEQHWLSLSKELLLAPDQSDRPVLASIPMGIVNPGQDKSTKTVTAAVYEGQDGAIAAFYFCLAHNILSTQEVVKMQVQLDTALLAPPTDHPSDRPPLPHKKPLPKTALEIAAFQEMAVTGARKLKSGHFEAAGEQLSRAVCYGQLAEPRLAEAQKSLLSAMQNVAKSRHVVKLFVEKQWEGVVQQLEEMQAMFPDHRNDKLWLMQARGYQQLGRWADTTRAAGLLMQCVAYSGRWEGGQARMMGVLMGAAAALEMDATEKALKFYQVALRHDPDCEVVSLAYKGLKKLTKSLATAEKKITQGYNRAAMEVLQEALGTVRSMGVDSGLMRSSILLKICVAQSEMKQYDAALLSCEQVVSQRQTPPPGMFVDPLKVAEALQARGRAHSHDNNWDDATRDYREALSLTQQGGHREKSAELDRTLREANFKHKEWNERRDHRQVLELPVNVHQLTNEKQCEWVKRQHKKLALKWHPDKVVGSTIERAQRKMREVSDAKDVLTGQLGCKGGRERRGRRN